jgi:hypothetical protein
MWPNHDDFSDGHSDDLADDIRESASAASLSI